MRLLIQSKETGRFLVPAGDGTMDWVGSLKEAGGGVIFDIETAFQIVSDLDFDDYPQIVDLDRLGTESDYI